jgi:hypothetical protein
MLLKVISIKNNNTSELNEFYEFNIDPHSKEEFIVKISLNSNNVKHGYYFQKLNIFSDDDYRLQLNDCILGRKYQRSLTLFWKVDCKKLNLEKSDKNFNWHKINQKVIEYKNIDQSELIELTYPSLRIALMLEVKSEIPYPKSIADYAKLVSSNNSKLEEEIKKFEEQDYFSNIGLDLVRATTIARLFFNDVTKNIVNSDNMKRFRNY